MKKKENQIVLESKFTKELKRIHDYIKSNLSAPQAAERFVKKVRKEVQRLKEAPRLHPKIYRIKDLRFEFRKVVVNNYIFIYTIDDNENKIYVTNIFYSGSNYMEKI